MKCLIWNYRIIWSSRTLFAKSVSISIVWGSTICGASSIPLSAVSPPACSRISGPKLEPACEKHVSRTPWVVTCSTPCFESWHLSIPSLPFFSTGAPLTPLSGNLISLLSSFANLFCVTTRFHYVASLFPGASKSSARGCCFSNPSSCKRTCTGIWERPYLLYTTYKLRKVEILGSVKDVAIFGDKNKLNKSFLSRFLLSFVFWKYL